MESTNAPEAQSKIKQLKKQLKLTISSPSLSSDGYAEDDSSDNNASVIASTNIQENDITENPATIDTIDEMVDEESNNEQKETSNVEIYKPESASIEGPKVIGYTCWRN